MRTAASAAACSLPSTFQLWAIGKDAPRQLNFREQLMHSLVKLFGNDRHAMQASRGANASIALVKNHYLVAAEEKRDCVICSDRAVKRKASSYICARCGVHLCIGHCFVKYHSHG